MHETRAETYDTMHLRLNCSSRKEIVYVDGNRISANDWRDGSLSRTDRLAPMGEALTIKKLRAELKGG